MLPFTTGLPGLYDLVRALSEQRTELDQKVLKAQEALRDTHSLLSELEQGLKDRSQKLEEIRDKYEEYSKLAAVEEEKAGPVIRRVELTMGRGKSRERIISLVLNLIAGLAVFVLGVILGPKLKAWLGIS